MEITKENIKYVVDKYCELVYLTDDFMKEVDPPYLAASLHHSFCSNEVAFRMTWKLASRILSEYKWPDTWWDAFKERWFPKWAKQRWPVVYRSITLREIAGIKLGNENLHKLRYGIEETYIREE